MDKKVVKRVPMERHYKKALLLTYLVIALFLLPPHAQAEEGSANLPPELNPIGNKTTVQGWTLRFYVSARGLAGDIVKYYVYQAGDLNHDGYLTPLDVLRIINTLNKYGNPIPRGAPGWNPEMDINNDGYITPMDVLIVIGLLNKGATQLPGGAIDNDTGYFSWWPTHEHVGTHRFTFVASQGALSDAECIVITVTQTGITPPALTDEELLDKTEAESALYFYYAALPNGFVKDASNKDFSSIAATGFGLGALSLMAERFQSTPYWTISPYQARRRVNQILDTSLAIQNSQGPEGNDYGIAGFFYHFITSSGTRQGNSEVSTIDTALFLAGAIVAGEYFGGEVKSKVEQIYNNIDWNYFLMPGSKQFSHGWKPETGVFTTTWDRPGDETILISLLAIGSNPENRDLLETMFSWPRVVRTYREYSVVNSYFGSLFTYLFAHCFFDFEEMGGDNPYIVASNAPPVNWWDNSVKATYANREFCIDESPNYSSYGPDSWGITACEEPKGSYRGTLGAAPCEYNSGIPFHNGTIAPYGAVSSMPLMRRTDEEANRDNLSFKALRHYYNTYYNELWGPYGMRDSFNSSGEVSPNYLGIDLGCQLLMIENYRSGLVWKKFMANERIKEVLDTVFRDRSVYIFPITWLLNTIKPGESKITTIDERISVLNDGDLPATYSLSVKDVAGEKGWEVGDTTSGNDVDRFLMSAIFTSFDVQSVDDSYFNEDGAEDLLSETPEKSDHAKFATSRSGKNGVGVAPGEKRALWLKFDAPRADTKGGKNHEEHFIYVEVKAEKWLGGE